MTSTDLKSIRTGLGWSQTRLAQELGVTRNTVTRWEMGLHPIPPIAQRLIQSMSNQCPTAPRTKRRITRN